MLHLGVQKGIHFMLHFVRTMCMKLCKENESSFVPLNEAFSVPLNEAFLHTLMTSVLYP